MALKTNLNNLKNVDNVILLKGGYVKDKLDPRDYVYKINKNIAQVKLPQKFTLNKTMPPVLDQDAIGSCVSNAVCNALGFLNLKMNKSVNLKSRLFNYYNTRVLEGNTDVDSGCQIRNAIKVCNKIGSCYEVTWPYEITQFNHKPSDSTYTEAKKHKLTVYQRVAQNRNAIKACLISGFPIIIGFLCYNTLFNPSVERTGDILSPTRRDYPIGGHCVLITGYNDLTQRYEIMNSWGTEWGKDGYGTIPYTYIENPKYAFDFWQIQKEPVN
jgi:C1A family cysteine protease